MILRRRRAVGGIISLVALIIVFGTISVAILDLNVVQSDTVQSGIRISDKQFDRITESLNFTIQNATIPSIAYYNITIQNLGSKQVVLNSHITINTTNNVSFAQYLDDSTIPKKQNMINSNEIKTLNFTNDPAANTKNATEQDKHLIFLTDTGKKCIIPIPENSLEVISRKC
ncbi:hypothetical protein [Nitrosopumilus sp.]|uniref:hypothetical protein n=1 Tax=Nitrosopumilus sp. TaxID=2024843 RepID=UPI002601CBEE|nr:hypothetical protein [Nitrosopumilus sp.]